MNVNGLPYPPLTAEMLKFAKQLHDKKFRDAEALFLADGEKLVAEALSSQSMIEAVIVAQDASDRALEIAHKCSRQGIEVYQTGAEKFSRLAPSQSPQGIMAIVHTPNDDDLLWDSPCILALDGISDPGNVGTILRTAEWFGVRHIICGAGCADPYNPKAVRASMGSIFRCRIRSVQTLSDELLRYINEHTVRIVGAELLADKALRSVSWSADKQDIIVLGSEAHGISREVQAVLTDRVVIEGVGGAVGAESLNVSMSAGIILYQRFTNQV